MSAGSVCSRDSAQPVGDYLLTGVSVMLAINLLQRLVGLARSLGFCQLLSEQQLGSWALVNSFLVIGVPLAMLGLSGGFGRFVEHYRCRRQLGDYLVRVLGVSGLGVLLVVCWMLCAPDSFSWLVFHQSQPYTITIWCCITFVCLIVYSLAYDTVASLRYVRVVSIMQFLQSIVFAGVGLSLIASYSSWTWLLPSFSLACIIAALPAIVVLYRQHRSEFVPSGSLEARTMWLRILPYAASLWLINLLSNTFELSDRYMLLHLSLGGPSVGQAAVGQYHCGRIIPNLLISLALTLGGILLPYLSADWEAGRKRQLVARTRQMLQAGCTAMLAGSAVAVLAAPLIFEYGFGGRYAAAESMLPLALMQSIWLSLFLIAEAYLLCAERGKELVMMLGLGLAVNLVLNWMLIQAWGLSGAVLATALAGLLMLCLLFWRMSRCGCWLGWGTLALCLAPLTLAAGPSLAAAAVALIVAVAGRTEWLLTHDERLRLDAMLLPKLARCGLRLESLWPR